MGMADSDNNDSWFTEYNASIPDNKSTEAYQDKRIWHKHVQYIGQDLGHRYQDL
jgi:hypothetical protein